MNLEEVNYNVNDNWYDRHILRKFSIHITRILIHTPVTANQVTTSRFLIGLIACVLFLFGKWEFSIIGAVLIFFCSGVLDQVDGEIARYKNQFSTKGIWIDYIVHRNLPPIILVSVGYGSYVSTGILLYFIASVFIAMFLLITMSMAMIRIITILKETGKPIGDVELEKDRKQSFFFKADYLINAFLTHEIMEFVLVIFALANRIHYLIIWSSFFLILKIFFWSLKFLSRGEKWML